MANFEFRFGAMNSGKSMVLLQMAYNYEENNKRVLLIKSIIDTKGGDYLVSRIGPKRKVQIKLGKDESILGNKYQLLIKNTDVILVDEAQFLTKHQVEELWYVTKTMNIPVICFWLKGNFRSELFEGSKRLIELCDKFKELETICHCGTKARFNSRKVDNKYVLYGDENIIDGSCEKVTYVPLCGSCYLKEVFKNNITYEEVKDGK